MGRGVSSCPAQLLQTLPFPVHPRPGLDGSTELRLGFQGSTCPVIPYPFAVPIDGLVAKVAAVERAVDLQGGEVVTRLVLVGETEVNTCLFSLLERTEDLVDEPFVEEELG